MKAVVLNGPHEVGLQDVPKPTLIHDTDVLIKVTAVMICTSEVHFVEGQMPPSGPFVLGHEFVGVIEEVGSAVENFVVGDRVVAPPYPFCNNCETCRRGVTGLCPHGALFGSGEAFGNMAGGMAEYVRAPLADSALLKIPDDVSDERAVFVPDMLATGYFAVQNAHLEPQQTVVVMGAGPVGLCAVQTAGLYSPSASSWSGAGPTGSRSVERWAPPTWSTRRAGDPVAAVLELTGGVGADAVIDSVGTPDSLVAAAQAVRIGGIVSIVGAPAPGPFPFPLQTLLMKNVSVNMGLTDQDNMPFLMELLQCRQAGRRRPADPRHGARGLRQGLPDVRREAGQLHEGGPEALIRRSRARMLRVPLRPSRR